MIKQVEFYLNDLVPKPENKWVGAFAIVANISKRLKKIKELNYRRWLITLSDGKTESSHISSEHGKDIEMTVFIDFKKIANCIDGENISHLYKMIFEGLEYVFNSKNWNVDVVRGMYSEIIQEDFKVSLIYGKDIASPDKKYKAQLYCELFTDHAEHFVQFLTTGSKLYKRIFYLKSNDVDPDSFFGFFRNYYWNDNDHFIVSDFNKEIFYVFNVNKDDFSIEYRPGNYTLEELQQYVKSFQYGISHEEKLKMLGLHR